SCDDLHDTPLSAVTASLPDLPLLDFPGSIADSGVSMALWMVRAGRHGEHEPRFFGDNKVYDDLCDQEHDAEKRLRAMLAGGFKPSNTATASQAAAEDEAAQTLDLERLSKDQIATLIGRKFRGHEMARLVDAVLKAQGYTTFVSPPGPDKGVDILAAPGPLGFGKPRICIQVKSQ